MVGVKGTDDRRTGSSSRHGLLAFLSDFEERLASHVLDSWECLMHKLEELVDDGLQELPVCLEEARILTNHVHDVTCYYLRRTKTADQINDTSQLNPNEGKPSLRSQEGVPRPSLWCLVRKGKDVLW